MGFRINTNIAAMNAHTNATMNNRNLDNSLSKLSSGLRINKAADDASGLVIANSLRSQASSLGQAVSNGNDAIGLIQTADGALEEYSKILDTIKTKSVQAASDGQNTASRLAIQKDIDRLMEELNVIAKTTSFNGQKLLSGTFANREFQMGANANESIKASIASTETTQVGQTTRGTLEISSLIQTNQLSLQSATTGKTIDLENFSLKMNNDPINGMGHVADLINKYSGETGITAKAIVEVSTGVISAGNTGTDFAINGINIGDIQVSTNDSQGTLMNAINAKTTQTGVSATRTEDGKLVLSSADGRAIELTGDTASSVLGKTNAEMSTFGKLELVQAGSSTFQITGAQLASATGNDVKTSAKTYTIQDSTLAAKTVIKSGTIYGAGTAFGADITATTNMLVKKSATADIFVAIGSTIKTGTKIGQGSVLQGTMEVYTSTISADMLVKAGSILASSSTLIKGTQLQQDITLSNGTTYKAGTVLQTDLKLDKDVTLINDMVLNYDTNNSPKGSTIASGSKLVAGTILGTDFTAKSDFTLTDNMVMTKETILKSGSVLKAGTTFGENVTLSSKQLTLDNAMVLKAGSTIASGSTLKEGSQIGGEVTVNGAISLADTNSDMLIKAGSILKSGSILQAGTVLQQDLTAQQVNASGVGSGLKAGTVLGEDITLQKDVAITNDFIMVKGSSSTDVAKIATGSTLAVNVDDRNSAKLSDVEFTNLSNIDVTTLKGAMKAMDTLSAAISNLDTIRSDLGSVQNQLVATINNISVTQVNVKAAESQLRDVDFAAESANFSKFNILAQSGSYAMSQANAVQQNVLRLLQ